jgi:UDP-galactopyranose mutase
LGETKLGRIPLPFNRKSAEIVGDLTPEQIRDLVFVDYSEKQWGVRWCDIPQSITLRVPVKRESYDDRYHLDRYQGIPEHGYTAMFDAMLDGITLHMQSTEWEWRRYSWDHVFYTGPLDAYFTYCHGKLGYRSLEFVYVSASPRPEMQINECNNDNPWTRTVDHSHWLKEYGKSTIVSYEYPRAYNGENVPFYPVPFGDNIRKGNLYMQLARHEPRTTFIGRLATYKYLDMDDVVAQAMLRLAEWGGTRIKRVFV